MKENARIQNGELDSPTLHIRPKTFQEMDETATMILPSIPPTPVQPRKAVTIEETPRSPSSREVIKEVPAPVLTKGVSTPPAVTKGVSASLVVIKDMSATSVSVKKTSTSPVVAKKVSVSPAKINKREAANIHVVQEKCRRLCLTLFSTEQSPVRSLGFTSSIGGEGKSFLAAVTARILAQDSNEAVTLIECNWAHPTLHETFAIPATPGLAEWLRGTCSEDEIRYQVGENLTVIPAGDGARDAVKLLKYVQHHSLNELFKHRDELLIIDLPAVIASSYGSLAASLVDTVVIVGRGEVTTSSMLAETCAQLKNISIYGIILNQGISRIPRWLQQLL